MIVSIKRTSSEGELIAVDKYRVDSVHIKGKLIEFHGGDMPSIMYMRLEPSQYLDVVIKKEED